MEEEANRCQNLTCKIQKKNVTQGKVTEICLTHFVYTLNCPKIDWIVFLLFFQCSNASMHLKDANGME